MKQITFRQLQTNTSWLNDLPVEIIRYGKVIARITGVTDDSTSHPEENIQNDKKTKFLELKKVLEGGFPEPKDEKVLGRCQMPGCMKDGEKREDMKFWDAGMGEYREVSGFYCDRHYNLSRSTV